MNSQDAFNDPPEQWNQQAFNQVGSWPHSDGQAFRPDSNTFTHYEQQVSSVLVPTVPLFAPTPPSQMVYTSFPSVAASSSTMRLQSDSPSSKAPNFANILQYHQPSGSQLKSESEGRPSQTRRPRTRTQHKTNSKDWEKYKGYIKKLYLEEGKTVSQIMSEMSSQFRFNATEQMYKNKLGDWGLIKYMPKGLPDGMTQWIAFKIDERKLKGLDTEFMYKGQVLPVDRIQQSAKRAKHHHDMTPFDKPTPQGLDYYTPSNNDIVPSPCNPSTTSPLIANSAKTRWAPAFSSSQSTQLKLPHMRLTWEGHGFSELGAMQREARPLVEAGRYEDAEHKLRESLTGFEYLFSSINECTLSVAYDLAELYSQSARMIDADAVLQWMSEQLVETFGLDHQKTTSHMVHVVDLYQKWGRTNDAVTVLLRAMEFLDRPPNPSNAEAALFGQNNKYERMTANPDEQVYRSSTFSRYVEISDGSGQKDAGHSLEFQLCVANARVRAKDPETEPLLLRLIEQCEELPGQLEVLILKSRTSLIDLYLQLEKPQELASALEIAKERFFIIMKQKKPSSLSLLDAGVDLAGMYVKASHYKEADAMFSQIENELTGTAGDDDCDNAIDFLIDIGMLYESHNRWNDARARFEHALALTLSSRGSESRLGRRLQTALDNRHFSMSSLQQLEYKSSLRKRLMEY